MVYLYTNPDGEQTRALGRERCYNLIIQIVLFLALIGTSVGFGIYADRNRKAHEALEVAHTCPLIYDKVNGIVTEAQMKTWAAGVGWTHTSPTWQTRAGGGEGGCACDADPDPKLAAGTTKTPVWIAPCDLRSLYPTMTWPSDFPMPPNNCNPNDHVKVCLEHTKLTQLWEGKDANGIVHGPKHCHNESPFEIFTGWDGGLYCKVEEGCDMKKNCNNKPCYETNHENDCKTGLCSNHQCIKCGYDELDQYTNPPSCTKNGR